MCFKPVTLLHTLWGILLFLFCTSIAGAQSSSLVWDTSFNPAGVDEPISKIIPFQNGILIRTGRGWHGEDQYFENQRWGYLNLESNTFEGHPILDDIGIDVNDVLELPDGSIVVAGEFSEIGGLPASNISVFVDNTWHALGNGLNGAIKSLVLYQDNVCAGGRFTASGAVQLNSIACWVDNAWQPLGSGIQTAPGDSFTSDVYVLASEANVLYAGGDFSQAGGSLTSGFAAWNGNEWIDETRGLSNTNNRRVRVYDFELGKEGEVYIVGLFDTAGSIDAQSTVVWKDGLWSELGTGYVDTAFSIESLQDELYMSNNQFFKLVGNTWQHIRASTTHLVSTITEVNGGLYVGTGIQINGIYGVPSQHLFTVEDDKLLPFLSGKGLDGEVFGLKSFPNGDLLVGGEFDFAGNVRVGGVARYNGEEWQSYDQGILVGSVFDVEVVSDDSVVVAGNFSNASGIEVSHIALWNGLQWEPLNQGIRLSSAPIYTTVDAIHKLGNFLYAGGLFDSAGEVQALSGAMWDFQNKVWTNLWETIDGVVSRITSSEGKVIFTGEFNNIDDLENLNGIVSYDPQTGILAPVVLQSPGPRADVVKRIGNELYSSSIDGYASVSVLDNQSWTQIGSNIAGNIRDICGGIGLPLFVVGNLYADYIAFTDKKDVFYLDSQNQWSNEDLGYLENAIVNRCLVTSEGVVFAGAFSNVILPNGEHLASTNIAIVKNVVGLSQETVSNYQIDQGISVFPNPVRSNQISITNWQFNGTPELDLALIDILGRVVGEHLQYDVQGTSISVTLPMRSNMKGVFFIVDRLGKLPATMFTKIE